MHPLLVDSRCYPNRYSRLVQLTERAADVKPAMPCNPAPCGRCSPVALPEHVGPQLSKDTALLDRGLCNSNGFGVVVSRLTSCDQKVCGCPGQAGSAGGRRYRPGAEGAIRGLEHVTSPGVIEFCCTRQKARVPSEGSSLPISSPIRIIVNKRRHSGARNCDTEKRGRAWPHEMGRLLSPMAQGGRQIGNGKPPAKERVEQCWHLCMVF
jgi:hypothetical protein